jgi:hypothetical protein
MTSGVGMPGAPGSHRHIGLIIMVVVLIVLACVGTYWSAVTLGPRASSGSSNGANHTVVVYHNSTIFQNTTHNLTTPVFHNSTIWQNTTNYVNGTVYKTTTIYVNTTEVVMIPVVNITGLAWNIDPSDSFAGEIAAVLIMPTGAGFVHSYPLGTVMWILVNITNNAASNAEMDLSAGSPFFLVDSQPSMPHELPKTSTTMFELSIGVPYSPGEYAMDLDVTVT